VADPLTAGSGNASTGKRRGVFPSRPCNDSRTRLTSSDVTRHYACHNHDLTNKNIDSSSRERRTRIIDELRGQLDCRNCHGNRTDAEAESNECLLISRTMLRRSEEAASSTIEPQNAGQRLRRGERGRGIGEGLAESICFCCLFVGRPPGFGGIRPFARNAFSSGRRRRKPIVTRLATHQPT